EGTCNREESEMKVIGRVLMLFWRALMLTTMLGMIAALVAKKQLPSFEDPDADEVRVKAVFEPMNFKSTAKHFRGGSIDCWYGGGAVDLREATLDPAGAHLQVRAIFGGGQIVVPETWRVTSKVVGIGGLGDGRAQVGRPDDAPHLTIEGIALFGGFGVMSEMPEAAARGLEQAMARRGRHHEPSPEPTVVV
ncbi:MAG TPA: hypothetical protein VFO73_09150, partial [Candidatus Limnocylindrales bacterium]|nr:hypothetical protein [Candidatus Limnocylindrales bacterium]